MAGFWNQDLTTIPYDEVVLFRTDDGNVYQDFVYDQTPADYVQRSKDWGNGREVVAWAEVPPLE
jgi:hypothetical protein